MTAADTPSRSAGETALSTSSLRFPVVGIGASAGGLTPLLKFFERMPADSGMAFVVTFDGDGRINTWNQGAEGIFGNTRPRCSASRAASSSATPRSGAK